MQDPGWYLLSGPLLIIIVVAGATLARLLVSSATIICASVTSWALAV